MYIMQYKGIMAVNTVLNKTIIPVFYYFKFEHKYAIGRLLRRYKLSDLHTPNKDQLPTLSSLIIFCTKVKATLLESNMLM